ncbi:MAG: 1-acyl-sn-glycerol-3-phosphate acyltransferase [Lachnospiraceae bacterium]|nr:1-acyl-sn-glycerol-3-phosphate acyltransferase [Lachnospiraceae bacterium]
MKWFYDLVVFFCALPGLLWFRPKRIYEGGKKVRVKGGVLTIANHVGYCDPLYLLYGVPYRRHHFVCTEDILSSRFRKWFLPKCLCIPIDRENMSMDSFRKIVGVMKEGGMVTMFPEGHIVRDDSTAGQFKSGMILMAVQAHVPILPVAIRERKHFWNRMRVVIGQPIDIEALYGPRPSFAQVDELSKKLYKKELELQKLLEEK